MTVLDLLGYVALGGLFCGVMFLILVTTINTVQELLMRMA